jgi:hypothetical protein
MISDRDERSETHHRRSTGTRDFDAQIFRLRRQAEAYRALADVAASNAAWKTYLGLAADYDDLADRAEKALTSTRS